MKPTRQDYCQFLISTQINYTQTYFAEHQEKFSHDAINRYLRDDNVTPEVAWKYVEGEIEKDPEAFIIFDDSVIDKNHSHKIELVRRQYSGNAHGLIKCIGLVNCLYVNPKTHRYWIIDWRIYAPDDDQKTKLKLVQEMFDELVKVKRLPFKRVLMDSWYATKGLMLQIHRAGKIFYCPLKKNRNADDSNGQLPYRAVSELSWSKEELAGGKLVKLKGMPGNMKVKLFRVETSNCPAEWIATNELEQNSVQEVREICAVRWKIEQYHREIKQTLGIEKCQCRLEQAQRNHIGRVVLAWNHLIAYARKLGTNIYNIKKRMLSSYMKQELNNPSVPMAFV